MKRTKTIRIRVSDAEKSGLENAARRARLDLADYVRSMADRDDDSRKGRAATMTLWQAQSACLLVLIRRDLAERRVDVTELSSQLALAEAAFNRIAEHLKAEDDDVH